MTKVLSKVDKETGSAPAGTSIADSMIGLADVDSAEPRVGIGSDPKRTEQMKVLPVRTKGEWVVMVQFQQQSTIELSNDMYVNIGLVIGRSDSILAPNGAYVSSSLQYGDVVMFQKNAIVDEFKVNIDPYRGRRLIVVHERNIFMHLPRVPFELMGGTIDASDIKAAVEAATVS